MSGNRLPDYLEHMQQAASDACSFVEGMEKDAFLADKRTQQAVIMSVIIIGEAATKVMDGYTEFSRELGGEFVSHCGPSSGRGMSRPAGHAGSLASASAAASSAYSSSLLTGLAT